MARRPDVEGRLLSPQLGVMGDLQLSIHDRGQRMTLAAPGQPAVLANRGLTP